MEQSAAVSGNKGQRAFPVVPSGSLAAIAAYSIWGLFPLFFRLLDGVSPALIVVHRVIWSLVLVGLLLWIRGRLGEVGAALSNRRTRNVLLLSSLLLAVNWLVFIWAVAIHRVVDTSLGYFLNPLVNICLGMLFLRERQNPWQWLAIGLAVLALVVQTVALGELPVISLTLALAFGFYGYLRKTVHVDSAPGFLIETIVMAPWALAYLAWLFLTQGPGPHADPVLMGLLVLTGPITAGALLMFAFAARRLRLTTLGMIQYIAPTLQFVTAIWVFGETLSPVRLASFVLIWISLVIYSLDSLGRQKQEKRKANV